MSTPTVTDPTPDGFSPGPRSRTLSVKNVPHDVWQRARQNALASNLSFGDYVVKLLGAAGPLPPGPSEWDKLLGTGSPKSSVTEDTSHTPATLDLSAGVSEGTDAVTVGQNLDARPSALEATPFPKRPSRSRCRTSHLSDE